jgi:hypothetical protein
MGAAESERTNDGNAERKQRAVIEHVFVRFTLREVVELADAVLLERLGRVILEAE